MQPIYEGFYARFQAQGKKSAVVLMSADVLVGDIFTVRFINEKEGIVAALYNRFGASVGSFDQKTSRKLKLAEARGWHIKALLSFIAYSDSSETSHYEGEMAILCYDPNYSEAFESFIQRLSSLMADGLRPDINLSKQGVEAVIADHSTWIPEGRIPFPHNDSNLVILKSKRSFLEKMIEQSRKRNKGCLAVGWIFIILIILGVVYLIHRLGFF